MKRLLNSNWGAISSSLHDAAFSPRPTIHRATDGAAGAAVPPAEFRHARHPFHPRPNEKHSHRHHRTTWQPTQRASVLLCGLIRELKASQIFVLVGCFLAGCSWHLLASLGIPKRTFRFDPDSARTIRSPRTRLAVELLPLLRDHADLRLATGALASPHSKVQSPYDQLRWWPPLGGVEFTWHGVGNSLHFRVQKGVARVARVARAPFWRSPSTETVHAPGQLNRMLNGTSTGRCITALDRLHHRCQQRSQSPTNHTTKRKRARRKSERVWGVKTHVPSPHRSVTPRNREGGGT